MLETVVVLAKFAKQNNEQSQLIVKNACFWR